MSTCDRPLIDGLFSSLAAQRRRFILDYLMDTATGRVSFDELVDYAVDEETHSPGPGREAVAMTLNHTHLPKLADEGLIDYNRENGSITTTGEMRLVEPCLEFAQNWPAESGGD